MKVQVAEPVLANSNLAVTEDGYVRLYILSTSPQVRSSCCWHMLASRHYSIKFLPAMFRLSLLALTRATLQDKLFCAARTDEANTKVNRMTDPWWVAGLRFDKMLEKHGQLVQVSFIRTTKSVFGPL